MYFAHCILSLLCFIFINIVILCCQAHWVIFKKLLLLLLLLLFLLLLFYSHCIFWSFVFLPLLLFCDIKCIRLHPYVFCAVEIKMLLLLLLLLLIIDYYYYYYHYYILTLVQEALTNTLFTILCNTYNTLPEHISRNFTKTWQGTVFVRIMNGKPEKSWRFCLESQGKWKVLHKTMSYST